MIRTINDIFTGLKTVKLISSRKIAESPISEMNRFAGLKVSDDEPVDALVLPVQVCVGGLFTIVCFRGKNLRHFQTTKLIYDESAHVSIHSLRRTSVWELHQTWSQPAIANDFLYRNMKNVTKLSEQELTNSNKKTSWHDQYRDSAWVFVGGLPYELSEGSYAIVFL